MTYYEKIKNMTLDELACWLEKNGGDDFHEMTDSYSCQVCKYREGGRCTVLYVKNIKCPFLNTYGVKQWLEREVKEND